MQIFVSGCRVITFMITVFLFRKILPRDIIRCRVGIVTLLSWQPKIQLAIEGKDAGGWYALGKIKIE